MINETCLMAVAPSRRKFLRRYGPPAARTQCACRRLCKSRPHGRSPLCGFSTGLRQQTCQRFACHRSFQRCLPPLRGSNVICAGFRGFRSRRRRSLHTTAKFLRRYRGFSTGLRQQPCQRFAYYRYAAFPWRCGNKPAKGLPATARSSQLPATALRLIKGNEGLA